MVNFGMHLFKFAFILKIISENQWNVWHQKYANKKNAIKIVKHIQAIEFSKSPFVRDTEPRIQFFAAGSESLPKVKLFCAS